MSQSVCDICLSVARGTPSLKSRPELRPLDRPAIDHALGIYNLTRAGCARCVVVEMKSILANMVDGCNQAPAEGPVNCIVGNCINMNIQKYVSTSYFLTRNHQALSETYA